MKRFHVHVSVQDLAHSTRFYTTLFGTEPAVVKTDYAKWMLDDPRINFAISQRGATPGVDHLGIQVDSDQELASLEAQLKSADAAMATEANTTCCYANSDKYWVTDPQGIAWETFHTLGNAPTFGLEPVNATAACCTPTTMPVAACCAPKSHASASASCC